MPSDETYGSSFGMRTWRRLDTFREGKNPFTGEIDRFYDYHTTPEERAELARALARHQILFSDVFQEYIGTIDGTKINIPVPNVVEHFVGTEINLSFPISDAALDALLDIASSANLYFNGELDTPYAAPTESIAESARQYGEQSVIVVGSATDFRSWLKRHTI